MLLSGTVSDPALPGASISTIWSKVSGPGTVTYDFPSRPVVRATFSQIGTYVLQLSASDSLGSNSLRVTVTAEATLAPQGWIGSPIDHSLVSGIVPVTVTGVTLQSGTLVCWPASDDTAVVTLNANTTGSGQIGALDTTTLPNGTYYLLLTATDTTGKTMGSGVALVVGGNYKAGRVTTTVTDLVVPAPGLPIRIDRTYDSLQRGVSSDFGYGWSLGINVQVEISNTNDVTLTLNGQRRTFYFTPISPGFLEFLLHAGVHRGAGLLRDAASSQQLRQPGVEERK